MNEKLFKLLYDEQVISEKQYQQALQTFTGGSLSADRVLEQLGFLDERCLLDFLSKKFHMPVVDWDAYTVNPAAIERIPEHVAAQHTVFPYALEQGKRQNKIFLAVADPSNVSLIDDLSFMTGCIVKASVASSRAIQEAIVRYYHPDVEGAQLLDGQGAQAQSFREQGLVPCGIAEIDALLPELSLSAELGEEESEAFAAADPEQPAIRFLLDVLETAVEHGCSEVHLEPYGQEQRVRLGGNGTLWQHTLIPGQIGQGIAAQLRKVAQRAEHAGSPGKSEQAAGWAGSFTLSHIHGKPVHVIFNMYPTPFGDNVVLKLRERVMPLMNFSALGLSDGAQKTLERLLVKPHGILLLISPPRQGKTTTLYAMLQRFRQSERSVMSVESPVEALIPGVQQIGFHEQMTYHEWLSLLSFRTPEFIGIEKVENPLLAQLAFELGTGTAVVASLTAPDLACGLSLFLSELLVIFGKNSLAEIPSLLEALNGIVSQRLVRTLCPHCKEKRLLTDQDRAFVSWLTGTEKDGRDLPVFSATGCHECQQTGFVGQTGLFDIVKLDKGLKQFLLQHHPLSSCDVRQFLTEMASETLKQQAFQYILAGKTSLAEARRALR